ncbi:MAG: hypothetical protein EXQ58_00535 [Acidobacteria bacterium]|nr:hypothetical protein [Acidobacteriota bacterium]
MSALIDALETAPSWSSPPGRIAQSIPTSKVNIKKWNLPGNKSGLYVQIDRYGAIAFDHRNASGLSSTTVSAAHFEVLNTGGGEARHIQVRENIYPL